MPHILLAGAGFSRNWGGWLADEAFEYLLGHPRIDDGLRQLLWKHKRDGGGFEAAVEEQRSQTAGSKTATERENTGRTSMMGVVGNSAMLDGSQRLDEAVLGMFDDMNKAFVFQSPARFEPSNQTQYLIRNFLVRFDAIFTLNQDLLLEQNYLDHITSAYAIREWNGGHMPGMVPTPGQGTVQPIDAKWSPAKQFEIRKGWQPFFKLHGSSNWFEILEGKPDGGRMLVIGGNKEPDIERHEILRWSHKQFREHLLRRETRLMVIGYSFRDKHINKHIHEAAEGGNLRLFIIDPCGVDVLQNAKEQYDALGRAHTLFKKLEPLLMGASRRTLHTIFGGNDSAEFRKVMRFFD